MKDLPTPEQWNAAHPAPVIEARALAPCSCPHCGTQMFFPFDDILDTTRVVRCSARNACVQTTISNPAYAVRL